jgi:hypothetical protein
MVTVIIRLSVLAMLVNLSLKLSGVLAWSYYVLLWPYYILVGISITFSCGSLLFLFQWLCTKLNDSTNKKD